MGKWATYRRRGTAPPGPVLQPPPAPFLYLSGNDVTQDSISVQNIGGTVQLWWFPIDIGPWTLASEDPWALNKNWGEQAGYEGNILRARETGNGIQWAGDGAWSEFLLIE